MKVHHTIEIARLPEEVFAFVADFENTPRWQQNIVTSQKVAEGPIRLGTKFTEQIHILGRDIESVCEITAFEPGERMEFVMTSKGPMECKGQFMFAPSAAGSTVTLDGNFRLKGIWRLMTPMAGREIRKETGKELEALKAVLEGSPAAQPSGAPASGGATVPDAP